jgi:uncharacterized membrane protein YqjE
MAEPAPAPPGLLGSLRKLLDTGLAMVQNRLELLAVEVREEKCRFLEILIFASAAVFFSIMAVMMVTFTVVFLFWESARGPVLIIFSVVYIVGAVWTGLTVRRKLREHPKPFADSIAEIKKDQQWLRSQN